MSRCNGRTNKTKRRIATQSPMSARTVPNRRLDYLYALDRRDRMELLMRRVREKDTLAKALKLTKRREACLKVINNYENAET